MSRKFFKNTISLSVLSEGEPLPDGASLSSIEYFFTEGDGVAGEFDVDVTEISSQEAARLLLDYGSDPDFFRLSPEGDDLELCEDPTEGC